VLTSQIRWPNAASVLLASFCDAVCFKAYLIWVISCAAFLLLALVCSGLSSVAQTAVLTQHNDNVPCSQNISLGDSKATIDCKYSVDRPDSTEKPQIALDHAMISFNAKAESYMHIDLTFRNIGKRPFTEIRTVYIEFDDEAGQNYIRRPLPHVAFQSLTSGETKTFSDAFLAPALRPGRYLVRLWIPSPVPALKFDSVHNFLLSNTGIPQLATRLNEIAVVTVER
jgi:hypothetical protein